MADTAADVLVDTLLAWGVDRVFGIPGDGINGIMEALRTRADEIRFVQVRHEEAAALMACGHAKLSGRLGVCLATSGPGGIHLLNGLYDAKLDGARVLAITGLQYHDLVGTFTQQDVELDKLFADVCVYNARIMGPAHMRRTAELACRTAIAERGVAHLTIPVDTQSMPCDADYRSSRNVPNSVSDLMAESAHAPTDDQLVEAAAILTAGRKVAIMAGQGALGARDEVIEIAKRLGAPITKPLLGKGVVPDDHPLTTGGTGLLGTRPSQDALESCDTLLIVGSSFPYIEYYPQPGTARIVQIDIDPRRIGLRADVDAALVGDAATVLRRLLPLLEARPDRGFLEEAQKGMASWRSLMEERGSRRDSPMKPQVVTHELNRLLPGNAIVTTDSGTVTTWVARHVDIRGDMLFACSGTLATMACALPYANAAALAWPDRPVVCVIGDGGLSMLMGELITTVRYDLDVKIIVIKNDTLGQIKWEQMVFLGNPEYGCDLQPIDYAAVAEGIGLKAFRIDDAASCGTRLAEAMATRGPVLVEATVDPHEPPMPPRVSPGQAAKLARSLARGTPAAGRIALTIGSDAVREVI